jgi:hypothetical protein
MDEDSLASYIADGYIPANGRQLAGVMEALPDFAENMASWLDRLGEWMAENNLTDVVTGPFKQMAGNARTIHALAEDAAAAFGHDYKFWLDS